MLEKGVPLSVVADIMSWSASSMAKMAERLGTSAIRRAGPRLMRCRVQPRGILRCTNMGTIKRQREGEGAASPRKEWLLR